MTVITDCEVREFVTSELPLVTTLLCKKIDIDDQSPLQELHQADDMAEMVQAFFSHFKVKPAGFSLAQHYPWQMKPVLSRKPVNQGKTPLTIQMFIDSAKAGIWLY